MQIQSYEGEQNPYNHSPQDTIANMNLAYWLEQMKLTTAFAARLADPIN